ncbi:methyl-accepting chemotaxis protein [Aliivibrio wodanis]|uniref:Methyl-accepting chemotaxis protein n=1 Tax=Aliivibrio wodanis TaxID=80852 RepID=A0A090ILC3_9GAMM|nr:methyl-accepting chemotaxis protein [Aliivibrio wodanis]
MLQLERLFMHFKVRYQILVPVALAILITILASSIVIHSYSRLSDNSLSMDYNSIDSAKLTYAQEELLHLRITTSRALGNPDEFNTALATFVDVNSKVGRLLSEVKNSKNSATSSEEFQQRIEEIQSLISKYGSNLNKADTDYSEMTAVWLSLPWVTDYIDEANELIAKGNIGEVEKNEWRLLRQKLYSVGTKIVVRMSSVQGLDLQTKFENELFDYFSTAFTTIEKIDNKEARNLLFEGFSTYSRTNGLLWEKGRDIVQYSDNLVQTGTEADSILSGILEQLIERTHQLTMESTELISESKSMMLFSLVFIIITSILSGWVIAQIISKPILRIQQQMKSIATGDLTEISGIQGTNEVGELCSYTDDTVRHLQNLIHDLRNVGDEVSSASTELAAVMVQSESNANEQKAQVELISTAVIELSASATQVDASASQAEVKVKDVLDLTVTGSKIANESAALSNTLVEQMGSTSEEVSILKDQTDKISEVITVIESISEQTNLLALNAAIEAARAGDSGRGFAVVADEVRVLAAKTQQSTKNIQNIIDNLQKKSLDVVGAVDDSLKIIHETTRMSKETNTQLDNISVAIEEISQTNSEMANAANEQSRAISSISENVNTISESINQNVEGIRETSQASNHLSELSEGQKAKLSFFKV